MDFGVAKMLGGVQHTATGAIIGSAKYMSPEQARGEHPDERADIYSMGVMLYEMAAGQPPFEADSDVAVLMKHASQPVPDVRQLNRNTPDQLVAVIEKALAKNRADRYQSVNAMLQALREVESATHQTLRSGTMPPTAAPSLEPIQKSKIPMWLVGAAAAVLLVLVLGVGAIFLAVNIFRSSEEIPPVAEEAASGSEEQQSTDEQAVSNEPQVSDEELNLPSSAGMVKISEDSYIVGREASGQNYASPEPVSLSEFWIDQHEVTNAEYAQFIDDTGGTPPESWPEGALPAGQENHPVKTIP
jgi:serine/threonine protein kinase